MLQHQLVRTTMIDKLDYFNQHVWEVDSLDHMKTVPDYILVRYAYIRYMLALEDLVQPANSSRLCKPTPLCCSRLTTDVYNVSNVDQTHVPFNFIVTLIHATMIDWIFYVSTQAVLHRFDSI